MKLYRIKRISDGLWFQAVSNPVETGSWWQSHEHWDDEGRIWKNPETPKRHLYNLCCWHELFYRYKDGTHIEGWHPYDSFAREIGISSEARYYEFKARPIDGPEWEMLKLYQVEVITVLDHGEKLEEAKDFMGVLQDA